MRFLYRLHETLSAGVGNAQRPGRSCSFMKIAQAAPPPRRRRGDRRWRGRRRYHRAPRRLPHRPDHHADPHRLGHVVRRRPSRAPTTSTPPPRIPSPTSRPGAGTGSGFVISDDGYIVTNAHVVEGANGHIKAKIGDGKTLDAKLVGQDASTDLALLKVSATNLKPLALGDSSTVAGRRPGLRDRQPVRPRPHAHHRRRVARCSARSPRPTASRSTTSSRPTRRSTPATPAARCSTPPAR